ncbi:MAG TPA: caspase family protein [Bryobacteraceae bacterium]|nr:caspase family protein [Bryobacteraceae bacterium]
MTKRTTLALCGLLILGGAFAQEAPLRMQLRLPDFFDTAFEGANSLVELPDRPITKLRILLMKATERHIVTGAVNVSVNGKGISNIMDSRNVEEGNQLTLDQSTLNKRTDDLFDPHENAIEVVASDNRGRKFYQNWVLRTGGSQNAYFAYSGSVSPDDPRGVPPDLVVDEPQAPPILKVGQASARITLRGSCGSSHPATEITLDRKPFARIQKQADSFSQSVEIRRDMKELVLEAVDAKGNRRSVVIPVVVQQKEAPKVRFAGAKYALIVGISRYGDAKDAPPQLDGAAAQADEMARELEQQAGFRKENIRLMRDDQATMPQLRTGFYDFAAKAQGNDLLVVYIAGRALHDPREGHRDQMYLASYGAQLGQIDATAPSFENLSEWLDRSVHSNHTFLIFDVGHPVPTGGEWKFPERSMVNNHLLSLFSEQKGRAVLVSGSAGEVSMARPGGQASSFAYWTSRGLAGDADLNQDHVVTAEELFRFVSEKVREESQGNQNPRYRLSAANNNTPLSELSR